MSEEHGLIQAYIADINAALKDVITEDILVLFRGLYEKEQRFAKKLQSTAQGRKVYLEFIWHIDRVQGGMKLARSYFRIRQEMFLGTVNRAFKEIEPKYMYPLPINYRFCLFAMDRLAAIQEKKDEKATKPTKVDSKLSELFVEIKKLREEIISKHLYLALNRAKIHNKSSYGITMEFEDLIQIANEGLVIAVDKYVMDDDSSNFHAMAIGRILGNLIDKGANVSSAHIGSHSLKKLYQIRKFLQKSPNTNTKQMAEALKIAEDEIQELMAATSHKSLDDPISDDSDSRLVDVFTKPGDNESEYDDYEEHDTMTKLKAFLKTLSVLERKVLILKGVSLNEDAE